MTGPDASWLAVAGHLHQACDVLDDLVDDLRRAILRGDREVLSTLHARYARGADQHQGTDQDWALWPPHVLHLAATEEAMDGVIYLAELLRRMIDKTHMRDREAGT